LLCTQVSKMLQEFPLVQVGIRMNAEFLWGRESGEENIFFEIEDLNAVNNHIGIINGFGQIMEKLFHLRNTLEIKLVVREFETTILQVYIIVNKIIITRGCLLFTSVDAEKD